MSGDESEEPGSLLQLLHQEALLRARRRVGSWGIFALRLLERATLALFLAATDEPASLLARTRALADAANALATARRWGDDFLLMPPALLQVRGRLEQWHQEAVDAMHPARIWRSISGRIFDERLSLYRQAIDIARLGMQESSEVLRCVVRTIQRHRQRHLGGSASHSSAP